MVQRGRHLHFDGLLNMSYTNPQVPHEVNVSQGSDMLRLVKLLAAFALCIVLVFCTIYFAFRLFAQYIPFRFELAVSQYLTEILSEQKRNAHDELVQNQLQTLAQKLAQAMDAPTDMPIQIHLSYETQPNAFATLGGNIIVTYGLLREIHSENALAMVLAHELAHIKNRDPIRSLGTGVTFSIVLAFVTGSDARWIQETIGNLTMLSFSRYQESTADHLAIHALLNYYGNACGADEFFASLLEQYPEESSIEFFQTHPDTKKRLEIIRSFQNEANCEVIPLSDEIQQLQENRL